VCNEVTLKITRPQLNNAKICGVAELLTNKVMVMMMMMIYLKGSLQIKQY